MSEPVSGLAPDLQLVTDSAGNPTAVILPMAAYEALLAELEDLGDLVAFYRVKATETEYVPLASVRPKPTS